MGKQPYRLIASALVVLVSLLVIGAVGAAPKSGLTVSLSVTQSAFRASEDVLVTVTLSNPTKHSVRVLKWFTPAEGMEEPLFAVTRDGQAVAYSGPRFKRPAVTGNDYLTLKAGESLTTVVDLGGSYDLSESGRYEIAYNVSSYGLFDHKQAAASLRDALTSDRIGIKVDGRTAKGKPPPPGGPGPGTSVFRACTTAQQSALIAARTAARSYAANSVTYLSGSTMGLRYTTWFGAVTLTRKNTVSSHFTAISGAMNTAGITFDCSSKRNVYAYVYPNLPYTIYLGKVYWTAPGIGTDSQAGTLIHEMSHFDIVANTDDVVYGQAGARNLAISDPEAATRNADSHEYFAENTPAQS